MTKIGKTLGSQALPAVAALVKSDAMGSIRKRRGIPLATECKKMTTARTCRSIHMDVLGATHLFSPEVWTRGGLVTGEVGICIKLATEEVHLISRSPILGSGG